MTKALSPYEQPLKVKHSRAIVISTFHNNGAKLFWTIALRQPLKVKKKKLNKLLLCENMK